MIRSVCYVFIKQNQLLFYWNSYQNMIHSSLKKIDSQEFLKQLTSAIDSLHLCISCLQVCKVFIEEVLAQKPCMYGNKFRLNLCIRFITHSGSIGHKNRKRKYKNEALKNFNIILWQILQIFSYFFANFNSLIATEVFNCIQFDKSYLYIYFLLLLFLKNCLIGFRIHDS